LSTAARDPRADGSAHRGNPNDRGEPMYVGLGTLLLIIILIIIFF
jgi:hypothetical protein